MKDTTEKLPEALKDIKEFVDEDFVDKWIQPTEKYANAYNKMNQVLTEYEQSKDKPASSDGEQALLEIQLMQNICLQGLEIV